MADAIYTALKELGLDKFKYYPNDVERTYNALENPSFTFEDLTDKIEEVELNLYKEAKIASLEERKRLEYASGVDIEIDGNTYTFYSTKEDLYNYKDALQLGQLIGAETIPIAIKDGILIDVKPTDELIDTLTETIGLHLYTNWQKYKTLELAVLQATSEDEVDAISWDNA